MFAKKSLAQCSSTHNEYIICRIIVNLYTVYITTTTRGQPNKSRGSNPVYNMTATIHKGLYYMLANV